MTKTNKIKSMEDFKEYNIICTTTKEVKKCLEILNNDDRFEEVENWHRIVAWLEDRSRFFSYGYADANLQNINFYQFKKIYERLKKQQNQQAKLEDFKVDENGRIIKINNYNSEKEIWYLTPEKIDLINYDKINNIRPEGLNNNLSCGLLFSSKEAILNYFKYLCIHTKLRNLVHRLNNGDMIYWNDKNQAKYLLRYEEEDKEITSLYTFDVRNQGVVYCLYWNFKEEAIKEIGEDELKWYLQQSY